MSGPFCRRRYEIVRVHLVAHLLCHIAHVFACVAAYDFGKDAKNASEFCQNKSSFFSLKTVSQDCIAPVFNL